MAIKVSQAFQRTSANPVDESLTLTKAQMKTVNDNLMPSKYFTVCQDDGKIYLYDKSNDVDETTGKYRKFEGGGGGGASSMADLTDVVLTSLSKGQVLAWDDVSNKWVNITLPTVPTKTSQLTNDAGFLTSESDPTVPSWAKQSSKPSYTASEVGLGNVVNTGDSSTPVENGTTKFTTGGAYTELNKKQDTMQFTTMPTASQTYLGKTVQFTGDTANGFTHNYFYECVSDGASTPTYSWNPVSVQAGGGGGSSYTAGDGINISNQNVISTKKSESGDIDEIIGSLPSGGMGVTLVNAFNKGDLYSTSEKMIGQWYDGKPLYQRVITDSIDLNTQTTPKLFASLGTNCVIQSVEGKVTTNLFDIPINYALDTLEIRIAVFTNTADTATVTNGSICYFSRFPQACTSRTMTLIVQYTKTTDSAVSIGEANEYSTDEKIIGTWIDGKPLWQRTFQQSLNLAVSSTDYMGDLTGLNIDYGTVASYVMIDTNGYASALTHFDVWLRVPQNNIGVTNKSTQAKNGTMYVTIQYTKTT